MNILFAYNREKDVENFIKGAKGANNPLPTKLHSLYIQKHGEELHENRVNSFIGDYILENNLDIRRIASKIERDWLPIKDAFINRVEDIFKFQYPAETIMAYLTTSSRCAYNIEDNYFFINMQSKGTNAIIMHEMLHFYTRQVFYREFEDKGFSKQQYSDIKESLTELLNIEFTDLMEGEEDKGYAQHREMRNKIREIWPEKKDIRCLIYDHLMNTY